VLGNPANDNGAVPLTCEQFRYSFASAVGEDEANELFVTSAVPGSGVPSLPGCDREPQSMGRGEGHLQEPRAGPLVIIVGERDHTVPPAIAKASYRRQKRNEGVTEFTVIPRRGHALTIDSG